MHPFSDLPELFQVALGTISLDELLIKGEIEGALVDLGNELLYSCIRVNHLLLSLLRLIFLVFLHSLLLIFLIIIVVVVHVHVLVLVSLGGFPRTFHLYWLSISN